MKMRHHNVNRALAAATAAAGIAAAATLTTRVHAGPLFSFENPGDIDPTPPTTPPDPPAPPPSSGFIWGHSFDANQVQHAQSTIGATDGGFSMRVTDPDGGFTWAARSCSTTRPTSRASPTSRAARSG